jgi:hypothetical protein
VVAKDGREFRVRKGEFLKVVIPDLNAKDPFEAATPVARILAYDFTIDEDLLTSPRLEEGVTLTGQEEFLLKRPPEGYYKKQAIGVVLGVVVIGILSVVVVSHIFDGGDKKWNWPSGDDCLLPGPHGCDGDP